MKALLALGLLIAIAAIGSAQASPVSIIVYKEKRTLELWQGGAVIKTYQVGLGFAPVGHKVKSGDGKTPEGKYYVCVKNPKSRFYLSLGISYPSARDALTALETKLISRAEYDKIVAAEKRGAQPPWNTALGGEIFIHGHGSGSDWTLGCVALDDPDMKELFQRIDVGTTVELRP